MEGDIARLKNLVKEFERELYSQKKTLSQAKELDGSIESGLEAFEKAAEMLGSPATDRAFESEARERKLLELFSTVESGLASLSGSLGAKKARLECVRERLEKMREYRSYEFSRAEEAWGFLEAVAEHYSLESMLFRPEIIGILDNHWLEEPYIKSRGQAIEIDSTELGRFRRLLEKNSIRSGFWLEGRAFRIFWRAPALLTAKADNRTIRQLDSLCILRGGKPLP